MATTHIKSFDIVGKKEDVAEYISIISPADTPFQSAIGTDKVHNTLYQWMEDQLRAVKKNTALEGADGVDTSRDQPVMRNNGTQILTETFKVSGTADAVKAYGRANMTAREMFKTGQVVKMDLEHSLVGTAQTYVEATATVPGEFAGVQAQIDTATKTTLTGGLTEAAVITTHQKLYNEGSDATVLMIRPNDAPVVAAWASGSNRTLNVDNGEKKLTNVINIYENPYGTVRVVKNRLLKNTDALLFEPKNWKLAVLRNWFKEKLAKTGDSDRYMLVGEFGLKHSNRKASGLITGITP